MPNPNKPKSPSKAALRRKIVELEANLAHAYHFADAYLHEAGTKKLMASGVLVQLSALGGRELIKPVLILDGLSETTIAALREDIQRSYKRATELKPKGV